MGDVEYRKCDSQHLYFVKPGKATEDEITMFIIATTVEGNDMVGNPAVFPDRNQKDWMRFDMERNTKRWRAETDMPYYHIDRRFIVKCSYEKGTDFDNNNYINGNYFRTEADAKEVVLTFKKTLYQYHKDHPVTD